MRKNVKNRVMNWKYNIDKPYNKNGYDIYMKVYLHRQASCPRLRKDEICIK
ncbi:hypothetical protein SAMN05444280_11782 [Tangfeifania diversioriginum]|uniref:Uncharacterized protein n=1 Tax=Tangfeifania diversioriginum TaxID=1168035 RepID=A0A1M6IQF2_9BACT|nr:hypothetical protein SAMN05444280_11782 [Tangfeifania diversioriginum]